VQRKICYRISWKTQNVIAYFSIKLPYEETPACTSLASVIMDCVHCEPNNQNTRLKLAEESMLGAWGIADGLWLTANPMAPRVVCRKASAVYTW